MVPVLLACVGAVVIYSWVRYDWDAGAFSVRLPGGDGTPAELASDTGGGQIEGKLVAFAQKPAPMDKGSIFPGSWPGFRGGNHDGISKENIKLSRKWPQGGPKKLWSVELGEGYASAAVHSGRVYVIDYDRANGADAIRCFWLDDGEEIWRYSYPVKVKRNHGMSRTVPAVTEKYVVTMGPKCHVTCLDAKTGQFLWMLDLVGQFGTKVPLWYAGQCPIIDEGKAIIAPGGKALMIAVDCATGEIVWEAANPKKWKMTHSSIIPMSFRGKRMYVYCSSGAVVGVSVEDGSILWQERDWKMRTNVPTPVLAGDNRIFLSAGYRKGSMMIQLEDGGDETIAVKQLWKLDDDVFGADQQTPIYYDGFIYGVRPDEQLVCLSAGGEIVWASGSARKFGLGPYIVADGMIFVMDDSGVLTLVEATPAGFSVIEQGQVLFGHESWGPMAIVSGRLIVRDFTQMVCLDVSGQ